MPTRLTFTAVTLSHNHPTAHPPSEALRNLPKPRYVGCCAIA